MSRPTLEVADIIRAQGNRFLDRYRSSFSFQQLKVFRAIQNCRTAALGGHLDACSSCGYQAISYNSFENQASRKAGVGTTIFPTRSRRFTNERLMRSVFCRSK
jgi:hypothetical protein